MNSDNSLLLFFATIVTFIAVIVVRAHYRREFLVNEGFAGLLYHKGKLIATLPAGLHARWGEKYRLQLIDLRKTLLQVPGQDVLSADNVSVKISVVLTTQVIDAALTVQAADNSTAHIYSATQNALRTVVAGLALETLLGQRAALSTPLRELIAPHAAAVGVQLHAVEVRDVMLPGDLRKAFSEALKARQEGQAALERARGESASLRNLANAARLLEGHPALATLRLLQTLEASDGRQTLIMNDLAPLFATLQSRGTSHTGAEPEET